MYAATALSLCLRRGAPHVTALSHGVAVAQRCLHASATSSAPAAAAAQQKQKRVAVVGAGQIGAAVAQGLLRQGHTVTVHDPQETNRAALTAAGATWVGSAAETLCGSEGHDLLITALPAPPHVRTVMEGKGADEGGLGDGTRDGGLLAQLAPGSAWIDHTTTHPEETRRLHGLAEERGLRPLEAPLTGGYQLLVAGMMTVLAGGEEALMDEYADLMRSYAATVLHMGPAGAASHVKIITNQLAAAHLVAAGEAVMMAKKGGVNLNAFFDGVRASAGNSYVFETEVPLMFNQTFDPGFFIELHCKDLGIARDIHTAPGTGIEPSKYDEVYKINAAAEGVYRETMDKYGGRVGSSYPAKLLQESVDDSMAEEGFDDWSYEIEKVRGGGIAVVHKNIGRD